MYVSVRLSVSDPLSYWYGMSLHCVCARICRWDLLHDVPYGGIISIMPGLGHYIFVVTKQLIAPYFSQPPCLPLHSCVRACEIV
jgi:hypothetical protein